MFLSLPIRILVINYHPILLNGLVALIRAEPDLEVVGTATTAEAGLAFYRQHRPDLTLSDLNLHAATGIEAIRQIRALDPQAKVIGLAVYELDDIGLAALAAGAAAILAKDQIAEKLIHLIRTSCI